MLQTYTKPPPKSDSIPNTKAEIYMDNQYLDSIQSFFTNLCSTIGESKDREGLAKTPHRLAELYQNLFSGYKRDPNQALNSIFSDGVCNEMIIIRDIEFYSMCEHHSLPFFGKISIGYIPNDKIAGISNFAELIDIFARRLQIQENLTTQIADTIMHSLNPKGIMVVCEALHLCMAMRGLQKQNAKIITSAVRGLFQKDSRTRMEFMKLIS